MWQQVNEATTNVSFQSQYVRANRSLPLDLGPSCYICNIDSLDIYTTIQLTYNPFVCLYQHVHQTDLLGKSIDGCAAPPMKSVTILKSTNNLLSARVCHSFSPVVGVDMTCQY